MRVKELAAFLDANWEGDGEREVRRVGSLEDAGPDEVSFVTHGRALKQAEASRAGCLLAPADYSNDTKRTVIRTSDPRGAGARVIAKLHPKVEVQPGIDPTPVVGHGAGDRQAPAIGPPPPPRPTRPSVP